MKLLPRTHYMHGCRRSKDGRSRKTMDLARIDCGICRDILAALRPRSDFPEIPTFTVTPAGRVLTSAGWLGLVSFVCPMCAKKNTHGDLDGHRVSHCPCWRPGGYIIVKG